MRVCFLILAHNNVRHFERLVAALACEDTGIFIHVDKKMESEPFEKVAARHDCTVVTDRVQVNWGGWSMVQATLNLLNRAVSSGQEFDHYCLISGSDFPLRPVSALLDFFAADPEMDYINSIPMPSADGKKPITRVSKYRFEVSNSGRRSDIGEQAKSRLNSLIKVLPLSRNYAKALKVQPSGGSQWWALTGVSVRYILQFIQENPGFVRFFQNTFVPDESFFQTVLETASHPVRKSRNLTYTDWSRPKPPYPAIIDLAHLDALIESNGRFSDSYGSGPVLFARKFPDDSEKLVERLEETLWRTPIYESLGHSNGQRTGA